MKKIFILACLLCLGMPGRSQQADQRIGELINRADWFALEEAYPVLKDSMQSDVLKLLAQTMIANNFNQTEKALENIGKLLAGYQEELGSANAGNLFVTAVLADADQGNYGRAADNLKYFSDQLQTAGMGEEALSYKKLSDRYDKLRDCEPPGISRPDKDIEVPVSIELVKLPEYIKRTGDKGSCIYIPVTIHGKKHSFIFDTGAASTYMSERFAKEAGVQILNDSVLINEGMLGASYGMSGYLDSLQINDITFRNVIVYIGKPNLAVDTLFQVDAVLGMDFMKRMGEVQIYPQESKIIFPSSFTPLPASGRNLMLDNLNRPVIKAVREGIPLKFFFDTGNNTADLYFSYYNRFKDGVDKAARKDTITGGGFGFVRTKEILRVPSVCFTIGGTPVELENVILHPEPGNDQSGEDGSMGMDMVKRFRKVTINLKEMFLKLE